jgi:hypothetical protein
MEGKQAHRLSQNLPWHHEVLKHHEHPQLTFFYHYRRSSSPRYRQWVSCQHPRTPGAQQRGVDLRFKQIASHTSEC